MGAHVNVVLVISLSAAPLLAACSRDPNATRIVARTPSPDGSREAIYAEDMGGGATVGPYEEVYVVAKGNAPGLASRILSIERACHLQVRWIDDNTVEVGYSARGPANGSWNDLASVHVRPRWLGRDVTAGC